MGLVAPTVVASESGAKPAAVSSSQLPKSEPSSASFSSDAKSKSLDDEQYYQVELGRRVRVLLFASAGLAALLVIRTIFAFQTYEPISAELEILFCLISSSIAALLFVISGGALAFSALREISDRKLSVAFCEASAFVVCLFALMYGLINDFARVASSQFALTCTVMLFIVMLRRVAEHYLLFEARSRAGFDLEKISSVHLLSTPDTVEPGTHSQIIIRNVEHRKVKPGDMIRVCKGEILPCDGVVLSGKAELIERRPGNFSIPVVRALGQEVLAGSTLIIGELDIRVSNSAADSTISSFCDVHQRSLSHSAGAERDSLQRALVIVLVFFAICVGSFWDRRGLDLVSTMSIVASILLVAPLVRGFSIVALLGDLALTNCFRRGVLIRQRASLSRLAQAKNLDIDLDTQSPIGSYAIKKLENLDQRIAPDAVASVLLALGSISDQPWAPALLTFLRPKISKLDLHTPMEYRLYGDRGLSAEIQGVEFSFGHEEFMLMRGVDLQVSDIEAPAAHELVLYLGMGDEVVARLKMVAPWVAEASDCARELRAMNIKFHVNSQEAAGKVDSLNKSAGVELASVHAGLSKEAYIEKLRKNRPGAYVTSPRSDASITQSAGITLVTFDSLLWNTEKSDVTLLESRLEIVPGLLKIARRFRFVSECSLVAIVALSIGLLVSATISFAGPATISLVVCLGLLGLLLSLKVLA